MKKLNINKEKILYLSCFAICFAILFARLYLIMFSVHDDMRIYTLVRNGDLINNAVHSAKSSGRITHLWNHILLGIPFLADSVFVYKVIEYAVLLFDISALYLLISRHIDKRIAAMSATFTVAFASISNWHNVVMCYTLCHQIPIGLLLMSLHFYMNYIERHKKKDIALSCIFLLPACMIYEAFAIALIIYGVIAVLSNSDKLDNFRKYIKSCFFDVLFPLITTVLYVGVYFAWKKTHMPLNAYDGTEFYLSEPFVSLEAAFEYAGGCFPTTIFSSVIRDVDLSFSQFTAAVGWLGFIKAFIVASAMTYLLSKINFKEKTAYWLTIFSAGIFVPTLLIGFTKKYLDWNVQRGVKGYVPSFYSYFFMIGFICILSGALYSLLKNKYGKRLFLACFGVFVFSMCAVAEFNITHFSPTYKCQFMRCKVFDKVCAEEISSEKEPFYFYLPDNVGINGVETYTEDFVHIYTDAWTEVCLKGKDEPEFDKKVICLRYNDTTEMGIYSEINSDYCTNTVKIITPAANGFNISIALDDGSRAEYKNVKNGDILTAENGKSFNLKEKIEPIHQK